jgi:hypothetical protein
VGREPRRPHGRSCLRERVVGATVGERGVGHGVSRQAGEQPHGVDAAGHPDEAHHGAVGLGVGPQLAQVRQGQSHLVGAGHVEQALHGDVPVADGIEVAAGAREQRVVAVGVTVPHAGPVEDGAVGVAPDPPRQVVGHGDRPAARGRPVAADAGGQGPSVDGELATAGRDAHVDRALGVVVELVGDADRETPVGLDRPRPHDAAQPVGLRTDDHRWPDHVPPRLQRQHGEQGDQDDGG